MEAILYNCHNLLNNLYDEKIYLPEDEKSNLRNYRDTNIQRVKDGTDKLSEEDGISYKKFIENCSQGSMAMHTINQAQCNDDHDIDHALIYKYEDISENPEEARKFVARAIKVTNAPFKKEPEARTNAVTIWYAENYHVDFAIYRKRTDEWGKTIIEHAGEEWVERDPLAITEWLNKKISLLSPHPSYSSQTVTVRKNQLRRIIRILKYWTNSRSSWSLPSGLALSVLAVECYQPNRNRDDIAFYETIYKIVERLNNNKGLLNPVDSSKNLLVKDQDRQQIKKLEERLNFWIDKLKPLFDTSCDERTADKTWRKFFKQQKEDSRQTTNRVTLLDELLDVKVTVSDETGKKSYNYNPEGTGVIPKNMKIKFSASTNLNYPHEIEWEVQNEGDEAEFKDEHNPRPGKVDTNNFYLCNERTAYKGDHLMICRLKHNGTTMKEKKIPVRIR